MHILVLGAGRIGQYVAQSLSIDGHSVVLVDTDIQKLEEAAQKMDVATKRGNATDWKLLADLMEERPQLLLALSDNDEANLIACQIAKSFGPVRTICRIQDNRFLGSDRLDISRLFHIDHIVFPELLVAEQIMKMAYNHGLYNETFFHGGIVLRTLRVPDGWEHRGKKLSDLHIRDKRLVVPLIRRQTKKGDTIIFPHGNDSIEEGDEATVVGEASGISDLYRFFGVHDSEPETIVIAGATLVGVNLAKALQTKKGRIRMLEESADLCFKLAEELPHAAVLHCQGSELDFMRFEKIGSADLFVAATAREDTNFMLGLFAKELGCKQVIAVLSDEAMIQMAQKQGIFHVVSPRIATTDKILALARAEKITSLVSLYDQRAEVMEVRISLDSPIAGIPLSKLGPRLPQELLFAVICNRGRLHLAAGSHILSPEDEVIIVCHPKHRHFLESIV